MLDRAVWARSRRRADRLPVQARRDPLPIDRSPEVVDLAELVLDLGEVPLAIRDLDAELGLEEDSGQLDEIDNFLAAVELDLQRDD